MADRINIQEFKPIYPADPRDLPEVHSNHVALSASDDEVYLDFCSVQPQAIREEGGKQVLPALVRTRVIMGKGQALQLVAMVMDLVQPSPTSGRIQ
ncbi:MAG: hypothetical protein IPG50_21715 [Myxococcales bacterium]|nr:hypothetical protein [Myxococcales bacterium]